jgi:hypothetical protein
MNHQGKNTTAMHYLLVGIQGIGEVRVARWFVEEGQRLRAKDPLVTLTLQSGGDGPSITLRVPREAGIAGAVVERIFCAPGARVTERDCLAVFTTTLVEAGRAIARLEDLGDLEQYPVVYADCVIASTSLSRKLLEGRFPGFARWYFRTHPLVPLLEMAGILAFVGLLALLAHSMLDALADLGSGPSPISTPWWDNLWFLLLPFFLGTLVFFILLVLHYLSLKRTSPLASGSKRRRGQR